MVAKWRLEWFGWRRAKNTADSHSAAVGRWGEKVAARYLKKQGYRIVGQGVRPNRHDELDIVARRDNLLVFVEVKTRGSESFGRPAAAVDKRKRRKICRAAAAYLRRVRYPELYYRIDIVEVIGTPGMKDPEVRHLENAVRFASRYRFAIR